MGRTATLHLLRLLLTYLEEEKEGEAVGWWWDRLEDKSSCVQVCLSGSAHLCSAFSNIPTLNTRQGQSKTTDCL